jgi:hypothetical protein
MPLPAAGPRILLALLAALPVAGCRGSAPLAGSARDAAAGPPDAAGEASPTEPGADGAGPEDAGKPGSQGAAFLGGRLVVWLDSGKGVEPASGAIGTWVDQSGSGNHAFNPGAGTGTSPALELDAINGLPAVKFAADTDRLVISDSHSLHVGVEDVIAAVVLKHQSAPAPYSRIVLSKQQPVDPFVGLGLFVNWDNGLGAGAQIVYRGLSVNYTPLSGSYADGVARLYVFRRAEDQLELRVNGRSVGLTSALRAGLAVDLTNTSTLNIGGAGSAFQALRGSIAEIVIARGSVAGAELVALEQYLMDKYGL